MVEIETVVSARTGGRGPGRQGKPSKKKKKRRCLSRRTKSATATVMVATVMVEIETVVSARTTATEKRTERRKRIAATAIRSVSVHEAGIVTGRNQGVMIELS